MAESAGPAALLRVLRDLDLPQVGPFPLYAPPLAATASRPAWRRLASEPRFEVLHFAPLYAAHLDRDQVVDALRAAARPGTTGGATLLEAALRATLTDADRATVLLPLASAVAAIATQAAGPRNELERGWRQRFVPPLLPFLRAEGLLGGLVLVSEHLGPEGRIFAGRPGDQDDNVIAVSRWPGGPAEAPLLAVLRELCYPAVTRSLPSASPGERAAAERRAAFGAVRCGARLADVISSNDGQRYRAQWASIGPQPREAFDVQYPRDATIDRAIDRLFRAAFGPASP